MSARGRETSSIIPSNVSTRVYPSLYRTATIIRSKLNQNIIPGLHSGANCGTLLSSDDNLFLSRVETRPDVSPPLFAILTEHRKRTERERRVCR